MTTHSRTRFKVWAVIIGVFIFGCVTGALLDSAYRLRKGDRDDRAESHGDRHDKDEAFERMNRDLNLSAEQATQIRAILEQTRNDYRALRLEVRPRYDALRQNARTRMRALLTPEQQQRFDARVAERDARRANEERDDR